MDYAGVYLCCVFITNKSFVGLRDKSLHFKDGKLPYLTFVEIEHIFEQKCKPCK